MMNEPCNSSVISMNSEPKSSGSQDKAYVLHARPYKNTSLILEAFTREHGRMSLIAKGARRSNSPYLGILQPFIPLFISWGGRSEMKSLHKAESLAPNASLEGDLIYAGFYLNELIMYLLHRHEAHAEMFDHYAACLHALQEDTDVELVLRYFELDLLDELGYGLSLDHESSTGKPVSPEQFYEYHFEIGVVPLTGDDSVGLKISGETLLALARRDISTDQHKSESKRLLRKILDNHLEGRILKTRELYLNKKKFSLSH